jgi:hypothetical protein
VNGDTFALDKDIVDIDARKLGIEVRKTDWKFMAFLTLMGFLKVAFAELGNGRLEEGVCDVCL